MSAPALTLLLTDRHACIVGFLSARPVGGPQASAGVGFSCISRVSPGRQPVWELRHIHGSAHQDFAFLRRVAPRLALVSCGEDNTYGHPAPGTVAALRAQGATVLRTDRDGALAVAGTGRELRVAGD